MSSSLCWTENDLADAKFDFHHRIDVTPNVDRARYCRGSARPKCQIGCALSRETIMPVADQGPGLGAKVEGEAVDGLGRTVARAGERHH